MKLYQTKDSVKKLMLRRLEKKIPELLHTKNEPFLSYACEMKENFLGFPTLIDETGTKNRDLAWVWDFDDTHRAVIFYKNEIFVVYGLTCRICLEDCQIMYNNLMCQVYFKKKGEKFETEWLTDYEGPVIVQDGWNVASNGKFLTENGDLFLLKSLCGVALTGYLKSRIETDFIIFSPEVLDVNRKVVAPFGTEKIMVRVVPAANGLRWDDHQEFVKSLFAGVNHNVWMEKFSKASGRREPDRDGSILSFIQVNFLLTQEGGKLVCKLLDF